MTGFLRLVRDIAGAPDGVSHWPERTGLVPFSATLAPQAHALLRECYRDGFGAVPEAFDVWWAATRHDPEFDAGLCFCVTDGDELVGFELCWTSGFVKDLVVRPSHRRRGMGEALLRHAFATFRARGFSALALKVDAENVWARQLYARVGFYLP